MVTAGISTAGLFQVVKVFQKAQPCVVLQQLKFLEQENLKTCGAFAICAFHSFVLYLAWKSKQIRWFQFLLLPGRHRAAVLGSVWSPTSGTPQELPEYQLLALSMELSKEACLML